MTMKHLIPALAALALAGACTTATPYQAAGGPSSSGYSDQQIENNRWMVSFSGNSLTDRQTVETYLLYRASELTIQNGYDNFRMVRRETDADSSFVPVGGGTYSHFHPYYSYYGNHGRLRAYSPYWWNDPFWNDAPDYREITRFEATSEILMSRGEKPDDPAWYSAEEVQMNLAGRIQRAPR
ncbi:MAG: hypothetical protein RIB03_04565 [Henriciella sp.]|uniref:CC0125/CC1285 family lipoprotein n=1 Tax=Henriciella sp. TaxID=1968823 RepID=UPI00260897C7|nr:hypothetical protein [Henriciella sp.]